MEGILRRFRNLPFRFKLLLGYSAAIILALLAGALIIDNVVRRTLTSSLERELRNTATTTLNAVQTAASAAIRNYLRAVAEKSWEVAEGFHRQAENGEISESEARARTSRVLLGQTIGETGYIYSLDSRGIVRMHPEADMVGRDMSDLQFIRMQTASKYGYAEFEWRPPGQSRARTRALYMAYYEPWDWIISVSAYMEEFSQLIRAQDLRQTILGARFGESGYSFVLDGSGEVIIHPRGTPGPEDRVLLQRLAREKEGEVIDPAGKRLVLFDTIPELGWVVASVASLEEFLEPVRQFHTLILATFAIAMILFVPVTFILSSMITRPVRRLKEEFARGAGGDFSARLEIDSRDEFGDLARYFNIFMARLQQNAEEQRLREEQIVQLNEDLERRVAERTARLEESLEMVRNTQSQLIQAEKMSALGVLVSWVAHEINTPVGIGVTAASHLEERTRRLEELYRQDRLKRSDLSGYLDVAAQSSSILLSNLRRAADLIHSFKQLSVDQASGERRVFDIRDYLQEIVAAIRPRFEGSAFRVTVDCPPGLRLDSYPGAFSQIFTNLILNSLIHGFAGRPQGRIRIEARPGPQGLELLYSDDGVGIAPELLPRIFEPFFTTRRGQGGSGLGLHIVYTLVTLSLGGTISADSTPGQGTTFRLRLPVEIVQ